MLVAARVESDWMIGTTQLSEAVIDRYHRQIIDWNNQLYGGSRTFEFMMRYCDKFNWTELSDRPPCWFNDIHFECFGDLMDWKRLTAHTLKMSVSLILRHINELDWELISEHGIRDEYFAKRFMSCINWNHPRLDTHALSTEFLFDMNKIMRMCYEMSDNDIPYAYTSENKKIQVVIRRMVGEYQSQIRIGCSIGLKFAAKYKDLLDWDEIKSKKLISEEECSLI